MYFNLNENYMNNMTNNQNFNDNYSLRDFQNHVISDEEPHSFAEYINCLGKIYSKVKISLG